MITDDFVQMFLANPHLADRPGVSFLSILTLTLFRVMPLISLAPFFGGRVLPNPAKVGLGLAFFGILFPFQVSSITTPLQYNHMLIALALKEGFIGLFMGFFMTIPFAVAESAGIFIDHQRGGASLMVQDPTTQSQASPIGTLFNQVLIYLFFLVGGPFLFIETLLDSYRLVPLDQTISSIFFAKDGPFWSSVMLMYGKMMIMSIRMASPALLMILMTDVFLGITNRLAPQVQITFLGMPLKSYLGLAIVWLGWNTILKQFVSDAYNWVIHIRDIVNTLSASGA
ncbi:MAG: type III secretion protein [Waddliaceae bacterium]|nr:type III secretion protein [Waddliaceae bacterium]